MRFWMVVPHTWHDDFTVVVEQSLQQLCPHWKTTERTLHSHRGQLTVSASGLLLLLLLAEEP